MLGPRSRRAADSADFVQEAWAEFLASPAARERHDESALLRRLGAIARNNVRDAARRCSPDRIASALGVDADEFELDQTSPGSMLDRAEQFALAVSAARSLPSELFEVFALRCFEGQTFPCIASRLARNEDTVRKQYYRAVVRLSRRGR